MTIKNEPNSKKDLVKAEREQREREQLEESSESVFRALSRDPESKKKADQEEDDVKITFLNNARGSMTRNKSTGGTSVTLRKIKNDKDRDVLRGQTDHYAFQKRYFNQTIFNDFDPSDLFGANSEAAQYFKILEEIRTDAIGSRDFSGVAKNMRARFEDQFLDRQKKESFSEKTATEKKRLAFELILTEKMTGIQLSEQLEFYATPFRSKIEPLLDKYVGDLANKIDVPESYYKAGLDYLQELFPELPWPSPDQTEESNDSTHEKEESFDKSDDETDTQKPQDDPQSRDEQDQDDNKDNQQLNIDLSQFGTKPDAGDEDQEEFGSEPLEEEQSSEDFEASADGQPAGAGSRKSSEEDPFYTNYTIFTREYDQIIRAKELVDPLEIDPLKDALARASKDFKSDIRTIGNRLKRYLMAQQNSRWQFDQEEGMLDPSRLARIVANPMTPLAFKAEELDDMMDTVVTILVDNSGSMRGKPIAIAATCTDMLARTLEQCGVKTEILGYTTKAWKGGMSRQKWIQAGKPDIPGRLNDLRHIIYKPADMPLRACRDDFAIMMKEGLLKENIDGESLVWAYKRLKQRPEKRKILIVISDGAPVDDSTSHSNISNGNILEKHLHQVIGLIEKDKSVNLSAIGIGHNVNRYYENSIHISRADQLASTLANQILLLFADPNKPATKRMIRRAAKQMKSLN